MGNILNKYTPSNKKMAISNPVPELKKQIKKSEDKNLSALPPWAKYGTFDAGKTAGDVQALGGDPSQNAKRVAAGEGKTANQPEGPDSLFASYFNNSDRPVAPSMATMIDPATGQIADRYKVSAANLDMNDPSRKLEVGGKISLQDKLINAGSGLSDAEKRFSGIKADNRGIDAFRQRALAQGPSPWLNLQKQQQGLSEQNALDSAQRAAASASAGAWGQLAGMGGVTSGAASRLAKDAMRNRLMASQGIRRQGMGDRLSLDIADEQMKMDMLSKLPQMELAQIQPEMEKAKFLTGVQTDDMARKMHADQFNSQVGFDTEKFNILNKQDVSRFNVGNQLDLDKFNADAKMRTDQFNMGNTINEVNAGRNFDMDKYKTQMQEWGAGKTAAAMAKSGKK